MGPQRHPHRIGTVLAGAALLLVLRCCWCLLLVLAALLVLLVRMVLLVLLLPLPVLLLALLLLQLPAECRLAISSVARFCCPPTRRDRQTERHGDRVLDWSAPATPSVLPAYHSPPSQSNGAGGDDCVVAWL